MATKIWLAALAPFCALLRPAFIVLFLSLSLPLSSFLRVERAQFSDEYTRSKGVILAPRLWEADSVEVSFFFLAQNTKPVLLMRNCEIVGRRLKLRILKRL